jgi:hypothetical protein
MSVVDSWGDAAINQLFLACICANNSNCSSSKTEGFAESIKSLNFGQFFGETKASGMQTNAY